MSPLGSASGFANPVRRAVWYGLSTSIADRRAGTRATLGDERRRRARRAGRGAASARRRRTGRRRAPRHRRAPCRGRAGGRRAAIGAEPSAIAVATVRSRPELAVALDEEAGDREHEERLPELRRLELERAELDPALRAADRLGEREDDDHERDRAAVDDAPVAPVDGRRDRDREDEPDAAEARRRCPAARRSSPGRPGRRTA